MTSATHVAHLVRPYLHGELPPAHMRAVQLHLDGCIECRRALEAARATDDAVIPLYLVARSHGELDETERAATERHLPFCEPCRSEFDRLDAVAHELTKNLSQYELTRQFRQRVMQEWKPHRLGARSRFRRGGLADSIDRAEAGNTFSYERLVDRYKDYAYIRAFLATGDFHRAGIITRTLFVSGLPSFQDDLTQPGLLQWLHEETDRLARQRNWQDEEDSGYGLSGYAGSRKLRRHRLILGLHQEMPDADRLPFLLYYVQRMKYVEIASLFDCPRLHVLDVLDRTTRAVAAVLARDDAEHPRRRRIWER